MSWVALILSGVLDAEWATSLGGSDGFTKLSPNEVFPVPLIAGMTGLAYAMRDLPVGPMRGLSGTRGTPKSPDMPGRFTVDQFGKLTLRHGSRLHHLGIGRAHAGTAVLILVTNQTVTVISKTSHQLVATHHIDPTKNYWRNQQKNPGRWPGRSVTDDATHV